MSLVRIALRIAAVEAIRGRTLVGDNVLDSEIGAIDIAADGSIRTEKEKPFISVYTEDGASKLDGNDLRSLFDNGTCELVFELGITAAMSVTDPDTGESSVVPGVPVTDRSFEYFLDMTARQILDALSCPDNPWGEICRGLTCRFSKIERIRAGNADGGMRFAAHRIKIICELMEDPVRGEPLEEETPFFDFLKALDASADPQHQIYAQAMRAEIDGSDAPWENAQRRLGMTAAELLALGRGPIPQDTERETPFLTTGTTEIEGHSPSIETEE